MKNLKILLPIVCLALFNSCGNNNEIFDASGTFEADEITVSSEANGKILQFNVQEGDILDSGQYVGYIDSTQLYLKKLQLMAGINSVQTRRPEVNKQIAAIQQQISTANKEKERVENLVRANAVGQKQLDDVNAQISLLEKQLSAAKSNLDISNMGISAEIKTMEIQIEQLNDQLQKCNISSPIKGTVLLKYAVRGELAMPGKSLFKIADLENMTLRAYLTSGQLSDVTIGKEVKVKADHGEGYKDYTGKITWISSKSEFTPKNIMTKDERENLVYAVKIYVKNDGYLKIGMYGSIIL